MGMLILTRKPGQSIVIGGKTMTIGTPRKSDLCPVHFDGKWHLVAMDDEYFVSENVKMRITRNFYDDCRMQVGLDVPRDINIRRSEIPDKFKAPLSAH